VRDRPSDGGSDAADAPVEAPASTESEAPQFVQNFCPGRTAAPHDGQLDASARPHSAQNLAPGSFVA
jgi:hypothetical protein